MSHHQFGAVVGDRQTGGAFGIKGCIALQEQSTVAVDKAELPFDAGLIALQLVGSVVGADDTVQAVWVMSAMDAGQVAAMLAAACERLTDEEQRDFRVGWSIGGAR